jgi:hypothetical protein
MLAAMLVASAAGLTKLTTLPPFLLVCGVGILRSLYDNRGNRSRLAALIGGSAVIFLPAFVLTAAWTRHADMLKGANPLAARLRSDAPMMVEWNFGSLAQRVSLDLVDAILRSMADMAGPLGIVLLPALLAALLIRKGPGSREALAALLMIALFLLPFWIFTNLHIVHNYYQTANGAFLAAGMALTAVACGARFGHRVMLALIGLLLVSQIVRFSEAFLPTMSRPQDREQIIGAYLKEHTPPGSVIVIAGLDWSPVTPYYAERRALMIPPWVSEAAKAQLRTIDRSVGAFPIGAYVVCPQLEDSPAPAMPQLFAHHLRGKAEAHVGRCDIYR